MLSPALAAAAAAALALSAAAPLPQPMRPKPVESADAAEVEPGCVQRKLVLPADTVITKAGAVWLTIALGAAGEVDEVDVPAAVPAVLAEAFRAAARACAYTPARDQAGQGIEGTLSLPVQLVPGGVAPPAGPAAEAGTPPREKKPGCVGDSLELPPNRFLKGLLTFNVEVSAEGKVEKVVLPDGLEKDVAHELERAVGFCAFLPGAAPDGTPRPGTAVLRFKFTAPGDEERAAQAPSLSREARIANKACLNVLRGFNVYGHTSVALRVSEKGEPSEMKLMPDNAPAEMRIQIFDALSRCTWEPALDLQGKPVASTTSITFRYK